MKKALSLLLVLAMVLSMVPAVFAEETANNEMILDGLTVAAGETKTVTFTAEKSCRLDLAMTGDGTLTINDLYIIEVVVEEFIPGNNEGDIDLEDTVLTGEGTCEVVAGLEYTVVFVGGEYGAAISVEDIAYPGSSAEYPILLLDQENTVTNNGTMYYQGYFSGMVMTVTGADSVIYNDETLTAVDGVVSTAVTSANPRMPVAFAVTGDGEVQINFAYPVGNMDNPAVLQMGANVASIEAGNTQGYYYTWTAPEAGTLTLNISAATGWMYGVNNMTSYVYGDTQWSDSDPVVNPAVVEVAAGDELQIMVNTYDPANMWSNPAGDITVTASFEPAVVEVPEGALTDTGRTLNLAGVIYINQYFTVSGYGDLSQDYIFDNAGLLVWTNEISEEDAVITHPDADINTDVIYYNGEYYIESDGIASAEYADERYMRVYLKLPNGEYVYTPIKTFSVQSYCEGRINKASVAPSLKKLCAYMLHYGAAAQLYFEKNVDDLANVNVPLDLYPANIYTADMLNPVDDFTTSIIQSASVSNNGRTLALEGAIKVNYYFGVSGFTPVKAQLLTWENVDGELTADNYTSAFDMILVGSEYYTTGRDIASAEYGDTVIACARFEDADGNVYYSDVTGYHPEVYASNQISKNKKPLLVDLCKAMVAYGDCAVDYFG